MTGIVLEKWNICKRNVWLWIWESAGIFNLTLDLLSNIILQMSQPHTEASDWQGQDTGFAVAAVYLAKLTILVSTLKRMCGLLGGERQSDHTRGWRLKSDQNVYEYCCLSKISILINFHFSHCLSQTFFSCDEEAKDENWRLSVSVIKCTFGSWRDGCGSHFNSSFKSNTFLISVCRSKYKDRLRVHTPCWLRMGWVGEWVAGCYRRQAC